jgi:hypothetical protein
MIRVISKCYHLIILNHILINKLDRYSADKYFFDVFYPKCIRKKSNINTLKQPKCYETDPSVQDPPVQSL